MTRFTKIHWSSKTHKWNTPLDLFSELNDEFHFDFDPCVPSLTGFTGDGLKSPWGKRVFCNFPYDNSYNWVTKGYKEIVIGNTDIIVFLVPMRAAEWFKFLVKRGCETRIIEKRLHFNDDPDPAPFDSLVMILTKEDVKAYLERIM